MKITFLLPPVGFAGGNLVVATYAQWLAAHGHEVALVSPPHPRPPLKRAIKSWLKGQGWPAWSRIVPSDFDGLGLKHIVLDAYRPPMAKDVPVSDVIIATWWETAEWLMQLPDTHGAKAHLIQGHEIFDYCPKARVEATYRLPIKKIVVSEWLKKILKSLYDVEDVVVIPNAVDHEIFYPGQRSKNTTPSIGFLYHETAIKGTDVVFHVLERVLNKCHGAKIYSFGRPKKIKSNALEEKIIYKSSPTKKEIREIYSMCDAWICASRSEGFNLTAMEAMACGTPVVSTKTGWPADVISEGVNGYLCEIDDCEGLFNSIFQIFDSKKEKWTLMSEKSHATAWSYHWNDSARVLEKELINLISG